MFLGPGELPSALFKCLIMNECLLMRTRGILPVNRGDRMAGTARVEVLHLIALALSVLSHLW